MKKLILVGQIASACVAAPVFAQGVTARAGAGVGYELISFGSAEDVGFKTVSLLTVPVAARLNVGTGLTLEVNSAWASGRLVNFDDTEASIDGPTDTELRLEYRFNQGMFALTGIAQLPTGSATLTTQEAAVAGVIAADFFPFRISNWGTGGGAGLSAAVARPFGEFAAGLSVGYVVAAEFEPLSDTNSPFKYQPGNELSFRVALDRTFGNTGKLGVVVKVHRYDPDQGNGTNLFRPGLRYEALGTYAFALGSRAAGIAWGGYLRRGEGEFVDFQRVVPVQGLVFGGAGLELPLRVGMLRPRADVRILSREDGIGQGYTLTAGADFEYITRVLTVVPSLRGRFGSVKINELAESGFTGVEAGLSIRFGRSGQ
jgi:hypothetical protein